MGRGERPAGPPIPFVVGMNRSGTTLLRMMLDSHPDLTIPPETHFVPDVIKAMRQDGAGPDDALAAMKQHREWPDFGFSDEQVLAQIRGQERLTPGTAVRSFYELYMAQQGKPRWGEKTPRYVTKMPMIEHVIPEARFIHVIRDGRDVALSVLDRTVRELSAADVARRWKRKIRRAQRTAPHVRHYTEVRYEDLITDTAGELRRICEFIELPWDEQLLSYYERSGQRLEEMKRELPATGHQRTLTVEQRMATHAMTTKPPDAERVQRWKRQMSDADREAFEEVAGELLAELGYETGVRGGGPDT